MPPEIKRESLNTNYHGHDIYIEAWQPEGGLAFVHLIAAGDFPEIKNPDLGNHAALGEAIQEGLSFATSMLDY